MSEFVSSASHASGSSRPRSLLLGMISLLSFALVCGSLAETPAERDQRMAWWREARFGMFIHWGIMSIPGKGWAVMREEKIPRNEYEKLVAAYNPVQWNAREVVKMAKAAGQKYVVLVAKHSDGFCMWNTKLTEYNIMRSPYRGDIVAQLAEECGKQDVVFCLYYSIEDWHHPDARKETWPKYVEYMKGQLRELLTNYGPIGVMWFDGDWTPEWTDSQGRDLARFVWSLQPKTIINNRVSKSRQGTNDKIKRECFAADFGTPEQVVPTNGVSEGLAYVDWESCMTMNDSWSWNESDSRYKSSVECIRLLIDTASRGGNLLLNIGPHPDGSIPWAQQERLRDIGRWMLTNSEAIYNTSASPFPKQWEWGRCTKKLLPGGRTRLYVHVFHWPKEGELVLPEISKQPTLIHLLRDPKRLPLQHKSSSIGLTITLPGSPPDPSASVIVVELDGGVQ